MIGGLFPLMSWEQIEPHRVNAACKEWQHYLGPCNRPYGMIGFGLFFHGQLVAVAMSAFLVKASIYGFDRTRTVECARLCTIPGSPQWTRVALRCYRETAIAAWPYCAADAIISYAQKDRHTGDVYRFDGWAKVTDTRASKVGPKSNRSSGRAIHAKSLWCWPPQAADREEVRRRLNGGVKANG